jgi:Uma2 family endonuclease
MTTQVESGKPEVGLEALIVRLPQKRPMTDEELLAFSHLNPELRIESLAEGDLIIMPPAGGESSRRNAKLVYYLLDWSLRDGSGEVYDSSGGFRLPNGAVRSPDAAWVSRARLETLTQEQREKYLPLAPEFVIELLSPTDALEMGQAKMLEYLQNGVKLGWLLEPVRKRAYVYTSEGMEELEVPEMLSADPVLPGFVLDLREVW